jgi:2-keto-4-pentenoate hydratase/2-oxohepta-3-ene-1,7-dioic acid hydratase in catechol pathway
LSRWVTYRTAHADERVGVIVEDSVYALEPGVALLDLLGDDGERLSREAERARTAPAEVVPLDEVRLHAPIPQPPSMRDFSSFVEHISRGLEALGLELGDDWYEFPIFYFTNPSMTYGSGETIRAPGHTEQLDYELEVAAVIGRPGIDLDYAEAERYIAGYCIYNDWSARDIIRRELHATPVGPGKGKDFAQTLGPYLVTPDELEPVRKDQSFDLTMTAGVNGREYSRGNFADIYWSFGEMIAHASRSCRLVPGDIICSGTVGTGCILELSWTDPDSHPWLAEGDEVYLEVEKLGRLVNTVSFGPSQPPLRASQQAPTRE